jgi:poly-gamma-glutamate synthesis protein (capsule biosynthesis protein)
MTRDADLAITNHESPIADNWVFHLHGFTFSGKPELTEIFTRAGIDYMSLANNHIRDFGSSGIMDTRKHLKRYGIAFSGAGKDLQQARQLAILDVKGVKLAIVACSAHDWVWAGETYAGATPCLNKYLVPDIRRANREADVVLVFPHWGVEYDRDPQGKQRKLAARWVKVGADLVLGHHSHVAGAIEEIDGSPIFYSLGNFIFDQNWATYTMESILLEVTFHADRLVQLRMHPFLTHDQAQPNFLDPARDDGKALLTAIRRSSFIDW